MPCRIGAAASTCDFIDTALTKTSTTTTTAAVTTAAATAASAVTDIEADTAAYDGNKNVASPKWSSRSSSTPPFEWHSWRE